jgi:hypothetical protein
VVTADPRLSYEGAIAEKAGLQDTIVVLRAEVAELKTKSLQYKGGRRPSGQPGATLTLVDDPDDRCRHEPVMCGGCGADLTGAREIGVERQQVFDLPPQIQVIEPPVPQAALRLWRGQLRCRARPVQYWPRITATALHLYVGQFLSKSSPCSPRVNPGYSHSLTSYPIIIQERRWIE